MDDRKRKDEFMAKTVMGGVVSVDGFIADDNDDVGPLSPPPSSSRSKDSQHPSPRSGPDSGIGRPWRSPHPVSALGLGEQ
jgi:hypothetical protein